MLDHYPSCSFDGKGTISRLRGRELSIIQPGIHLYAMECQKFTTERIINLHWWTPYLLSFRTTRSDKFRFVPGQYTRLGLRDENGREIWRPYSMVSAAYEEQLEFFSIIVPRGEFTTLVKKCAIDDEILIDKGSYGFLTTDRFHNGRDLWLLATGTGLAPFMSILHDPQTWSEYRNIILVHSVRYADDLAYRERLCSLRQHPLIGARADQFLYVPVVTRERTGDTLSERIPALIADGTLESHTGLTFHEENSRIMICGNPDMVDETRKLFRAKGYTLSKQAQPGQLAIENAF